MVALRVRAALACLSILFAWAESDAQDVSAVAGELTLQEAVRETLARNPDLRAYSADVGR